MANPALNGRLRSRVRNVDLAILPPERPDAQILDSRLPRPI